MNRILAVLPAHEFSQIEPDLEQVVVAPKQSIHTQGQPVEHVWFPHAGVFSMTTPLADGTLIEAASVGREGAIGIEALFRSEPTAGANCILQVPDGFAARMTLVAFQRHVPERRVFREALGRYAHALLVHLMQSTACNAHHDAYERCCRWLLTTSDLLGRQCFPLSHEFLAAMIGVRRSTVTVIAGRLQDAGLIRYVRGQMELVNRAGLEAAACECYLVVKAAYLENGRDLQPDVRHRAYRRE